MEDMADACDADSRGQALEKHASWSLADGPNEASSVAFYGEACARVPNNLVCGFFGKRCSKLVGRFQGSTQK